ECRQQQLAVVVSASERRSAALHGGYFVVVADRDGLPLPALQRLDGGPLLLARPVTELRERLRQRLVESLPGRDPITRLWPGAVVPGQRERCQRELRHFGALQLHQRFLQCHLHW